MTTPLVASAVESSVSNRSRTTILFCVLLIAALFAPLVIYPIFLMKVLCFALFACAFNLLIGYAGLLSFGHAAFFGSAAYITGHVVKVWGVSPEIGILLGVLNSLALGAVFGFIAIRRQGIYFAMITLAISQLVYFMALQLPFTHGEDGIQGIPRGYLFGVIDLNDTFAMYFTVLAIFVFGFALIWRTVHSPFGHTLHAIRDNEQRMISLGYRTERYKLVAFILSAGLSGLAGSTKALVFQLATLTDVTWQMSGEVVLMTLLGGMGTLFGPVVGAVVVLSLENYLSVTNLPVPVVIGITFVVCVMLFRRGIVGELKRFAESRARRR